MKIKLLSVMLVIAFFSAKASDIAELKQSVPYVTHSEIVDDGNSGSVCFTVEAPSANRYFAELWFCPAQLADESFSSYGIEINGKVVGSITSDHAGWQNVRITDTPTVDLVKGTNRIVVRGKGMDIPSVEYIKFGRNSAEATIDSESYDEFMSKIESGETFGTTLPVPRKTTIPGNPESSVDIYTVPLTYTYYKLIHCNKGDHVNLATQTGSQRHYLELFYCGGDADKSQGINWLNYSDTKENNMGISYISAKIDVIIPQDGIYCIKLRGSELNPTGKVKLKFNGTLYSACAFSYTPVEFGFPAGTGPYRVEAHENGVQPDKVGEVYNSPQIFIEGAASEPGRIVESTLRNNVMGSGLHQSGVCTSYKVRTTGIHIAPANSHAPKRTANVYVWKYPYVESQMAKQRIGVAGVEETMLGTLETTVTDVSDQITVSASGMQAIEIYDMNGMRTYSAECNEETLTISADRFAVSGTGIYFIRIQGADDFSVRKIIVK